MQLVAAVSLSAVPYWRQGVVVQRKGATHNLFRLIALNAVVWESTSLCSQDSNTAKGRRALRAIGSSDGNKDACKDRFCDGQQEEA